MKAKFLPYIFFVLLGLASKTNAQTNISQLQQQLQKELENIVQTDQLPGATLALVLPDDQLLSLSAGFSDKEVQSPMLPGARMFSGSVGKLFVAAVLLQLMEEKGISLDVPVAPFFEAEKWFARIPNAQDLTIRMLLQHTSGIPRYIFQASFLEDLKANPMKDRSPAELLSHVLDMEPTHPAGKGWGYSDTNFIILGMLIEKWSGDTFYNQTQKRIIEPIRLRNTIPSNRRELEGLTQGYIGDRNFFSLPTKTVENGKYAINPQFEWTGGGFVTNVEDLARLLKAIHEGQLIPEAFYPDMLQAVDYQSGQPAEAGYGLANFVWTTTNGIHYGHAGVFPGHLSRVDYVKDHGFSIAFQYNTDQGMGRNMGSRLEKMSELVIAAIKDQPSADEVAILANFKQQEACWNKADIDCYMQAYYPSNDIKTISRAGVTYGYENIRRQYKQYWNAENMGQLHFDQLRLQSMTAGFYLVTGRFNLERGETVSRGHFSAVFQKIEGKWYMVSDHSS